MLRRRSLNVFRLCLALPLVLAAAAAPYRAFAHAVLVSSSPSEGAVIDGSAPELILKYNSRIDIVRSSLLLVLPGGQQQALTPDPHAAPNILQAKTAHLVKGSYTLRWQVLASDGHISRGVLAFAVR